MYMITHALARERMRELAEQARNQRLKRVATEMAAANRWSYLAARVDGARERRSQRARQAAEAWAVTQDR